MEYVYSAILHKKVPHGEFSQDHDGNIFFKRVLTWKYARFSDHTFCINKDILKRKWWEKTKYIKFILSTQTEGVKVYTIIKDNALIIGEIKKNEYGEENLRIPISACQVKLITT
jgi:hypothetical protein